MNGPKTTAPMADSAGRRGPGGWLAVRLLVGALVATLALALAAVAVAYLRYQLRRNGNMGTHCSPLALCMGITRGPVLELGCGYYSTPLLHALCARSGRRLHTAETNDGWMARFAHLASPWHTFEHVPGVAWGDYRITELACRWNRRRADAWRTVGAGRRWGLAFVDHSPGFRRAEEIRRLRPSVDVFVVHDSEDLPFNRAVFGLRPYVDGFRYSYRFRMFNPETLVLSDTVDVASIFRPLMGS